MRNVDKSRWALNQRCDTEGLFAGSEGTRGRRMGRMKLPDLRRLADCGEVGTYLEDTLYCVYNFIISNTLRIYFKSFSGRGFVPSGEAAMAVGAL